MVIYITGCFIFAEGGWYMIDHPRTNIDIFMGWLGVLFFGLGGLMLLYLAIKEFLFRKPYLTITDQSVIARSLTTKEYMLEDVDSFQYLKNWKLIGIYYKKGARRKKGFLSAYCLAMKPEELCELLNSRLQ